MDREDDLRALDSERLFQFFLDGDALAGEILFARALDELRRRIVAHGLFPALRDILTIDDIAGETMLHFLSGCGPSRHDSRKGELMGHLWTVMDGVIKDLFTRSRTQSRGGGAFPVPIDGNTEALALPAAGPSPTAIVRSREMHHQCMALLPAEHLDVWERLAQGEIDRREAARILKTTTRAVRRVLHRASKHPRLDRLVEGRPPADARRA